MFFVCQEKRGATAALRKAGEGRETRAQCPRERAHGHEVGEKMAGETRQNGWYARSQRSSWKQGPVNKDIRPLSCMSQSKMKRRSSTKRKKMNLGGLFDEKKKVIFEPQRKSLKCTNESKREKDRSQILERFIQVVSFSQPNKENKASVVDFFFFFGACA